jgi:hypothetical protein
MTRLLVLGLSFCVATTAVAQTPRHNLGTLTCTLAASGEKQQTPPVEERAMRCAFKPTESGAELTYSGSIKSSGPSEALEGKKVMIWVVQGPADTKIDASFLAQTYVGGAVDTPAKGANANMLVGERDRDIIMQTETVPGASSPPIMMMELKIESVPA